MFEPVDSSVKFPELELDVLEFWKERDIYHRSLARREGAEPFVFYEGPPTANGMPHPGHCLTRAIKDLFPRYKTMRGYRCERKAGWDTHGLPVEVEVCKELGIHSKEEIEAYGVEPFIQKCQASVWRYIGEWRKLTERIGFWVDLEEAYVTYHQSYIESVWWSVKQLFDRGLLYQGHKIVWWWAQGGTALSAGEVGQGYREVADPSVYVKFPIVADGRAKELGLDESTSLLVWTTTPWTLPSNQFAAVSPETEYSLIDDPSEPGKRLIVASALKESIVFSWLRTAFGKHFKILDQFKVAMPHLPGDGSAEDNVIGAADLRNAIADQVEGRAAHHAVSQDDRHVALEKVAIKAEKRFVGEQLVRLRYLPPFDCYYKDFEGSAELPPSEWLNVYWRVMPAEFVTTDTGTGIVHIAPAFGEDDFALWMDVLKAVAHPHFQPLFCVAPDGRFTDEAPEFCRGRWVKDCDKDLIRDLKDRGLLYHQEQYVHDYPFCWRAEEDPLIQYPRESWFIQTTAYKEAMLENNYAVNWLPEHIKTGRMGKFLETNVDWALSRERYWGTPLPIWECGACSRQQAVGSYDELMAKPGLTGTEAWENAKRASPELPDDLRIHKPYIDAVEYPCEECGKGTMRRVSEVIDCWYDSGAMPFAQWGFRGQESGEQRERFESQFPADFISEALDQTRGWFYSQLAISTMLWSERSEFGGPRSEKASAASALTSDLRHPHPFKNCVVLGLMLGEDGQKMSKQKRNYREPNEIFDRYGADALRWYLFANQPPWTSIRYSEQAIKDSIPEFLLRLWNCYSFLVIYAGIDGWDPAEEVARGKDAGGRGKGERQLAASEFAAAPSYRPFSERSELDRWVLGELHRTTAAVIERMDAYDNFAACAAIKEFVDALSNWWVRRSRDRFWAKETRTAEKLDAYWTLYECLVTTSKLIAPFTPFLAETFWRNLAGVFGDGALESVHLCDYPMADAAAIDEALSERMAQVRLISSLGRRAREGASLKVRQPLSRVEVILADNRHQSWLEEHASVIADELNVKAVEYTDEPEKYVHHEVLPNFKLLGPKLGKLMPKVKKALNQQSGSALLANLRDNGLINLTVDGQAVELTPEEVEVRITAREGYAAANDKGVVVVLATELTPELVAEGLARDLIRVIQDTRKDTGCEFTDRVEVGVETDCRELAAAIDTHRKYIAGETLAVGIVDGVHAGVEPVTTELGGGELRLTVKVVSEV